MSCGVHRMTLWPWISKDSFDLFRRLNGFPGCVAGLTGTTGMLPTESNLLGNTWGRWEGSHHFSQGENVMNDLGGYGKPSDIPSWKLTNIPYQRWLGRWFSFFRKVGYVSFFWRVAVTNLQGKGSDEKDPFVVQSGIVVKLWVCRGCSVYLISDGFAGLV